MAIVKSCIHNPRYRSLAEDEEVEFDLAEGRKGRFEAANVTGPGGKNVFGTSIVIHQRGNYGPRHVFGIDEDGYRSFRSYRGPLNPRRKRDDNSNQANGPKEALPSDSKDSSGIIVN